MESKAALVRDGLLFDCVNGVCGHREIRRYPEAIRRHLRISSQAKIGNIALRDQVIFCIPTVSNDGEGFRR